MHEHHACSLHIAAKRVLLMQPRHAAPAPFEQQVGGRIAYTAASIQKQPNSAVGLLMMSVSTSIRGRCEQGSDIAAPASM